MQSSYPMRNIDEPHPHDVLCGRGAGIGRHIGNLRFRELIKDHQLEYLKLEKDKKMLLTQSIVFAVRCLNPPGRFLQKDPSTGLFYDIGDHKAQDKTSQALREGAPKLRQKLAQQGGDQPKISQPQEAPQEVSRRISCSGSIPPPTWEAKPPALQDLPDWIGVARPDYSQPTELPARQVSAEIGGDIFDDASSISASSTGSKPKRSFLDSFDVDDDFFDEEVPVTKKQKSAVGKITVEFHLQEQCRAETFRRLICDQRMFFENMLQEQQVISDDDDASEFL